ncbi:hypothetical protein B0H14DRAFT_2634853 [Mycena olivaceomarginata]|nr:hypothetical protein B0H14DRAFT_2634853 [Mycena olivaceomarginata]
MYSLASSELILKDARCSGLLPDDWAGAIGMNDGFDPFGGLRILNAGATVELRPQLGRIHRGMEEYSSQSAGRGMSAHNVTPLWPILNMPPASPSTGEKRGRDERGAAPGAQRQGEEARPAFYLDAHSAALPAFTAVLGGVLVKLFILEAQ